MRKSYSWLFLLIVLLMGCSFLQDRPVSIPVGLTKPQQLDFEQSIRKCCYDTITRTLYIMPENDNAIHIFRDGKRINTIGKLGFDKSNFSRLDDIALAPDGKILALDSFSRKIKKFDKDGMWIADYDLSYLKEPTRFDVTDDEEMYIYDNFSKDITIVTSTREEERFTFGKFQFTRPQRITTNREYVWIYDAGDDTTLIYNAMGQHLEDVPGFMQLDRFNQKFTMLPNAIEQQSTGAKLAMGIERIKSFFIESGAWVVVREGGVTIYESKYEIQPLP